MKLSKKFLIFGGLIVFALGLGIVTSRALAQDTGPDSQTEAANQVQDTGTSEDSDRVLRFGKGVLGWVGSRSGGLGSTAELEAAAVVLGMTSDELKTQLQAGVILADLADEAGVNLQTLRDAVEAARTEELKANITQAVTDGSMTQTEADWRLKGIELGYSSGLGKGLLNARGDLKDAQMTAAAEVLGITVQDLENQLWAGRSLSAIAGKAGVELQSVTDAMTAARSTAATQEIEQALADGTITQEQADWLLEGVQNGYGRMGKGLGELGLEGRGGHGGRGGHD